MPRNIVLIPSNILIEKEMQYDLGEIPPVLIFINGKSLMEHILDYYQVADAIEKTESELYIIANKKSEAIRSHLANKRISQIKIIDTAETKQLGEAVLLGMENIGFKNDDVLTIHFGDTLIGYSKTQFNDAVWYDELRESYRWTTFKVHNKKIKSIQDKMVSESVEENKVFVGVFKISKPNEFYSGLKKEFDKKSKDIFYEALFAYLSNKEYGLVKVDKWLDFGHLDNFYKAKKEMLNKRYFNQIKIDENKGYLEKRSNNMEKLSKEIQWYFNVPKSIRYYLPQLYEYSLEENNIFVRMEYYGYPSLGDYFIFLNQKMAVWNKIIDKLFYLLGEIHEIRKSVDKNEYESILRKMYIEKTENRLFNLRKNPDFKNWFEKSMTINGKNYLPVDEYIKLLPEVFKFLIQTQEQNLSVIHGDFCLSNILYDPKHSIIKIIDPRGSFGDESIYGDFRYDVAKLLHSFEGNYEFIINNLFEITDDDNIINYTFFKENDHHDISGLFYKRLNERYSDNVLAIEFIEALLFLSMVPLHGDNLNRQKIMLSLGIEKIDVALRKSDILK